MATADETFTLLPLTIDPQSKAISSPTPSLAAPLTALNALHRTLLSLPDDAKTTPPPPLPVPPKRSAQVQKMREGGNTSLRKATTSSSTTTSNKDTSNPAATEAIKLYTYGLEMALQRPGWEPAALVREEASVLFANRAQAWMVVGGWAEASADAATSVELKRGPGNGKAWWRRGKALCEMGRWVEAEGWVREGLEVEEAAAAQEEGGGGGGSEAELRTLLKEIEARVGGAEGRR